MTRKEFIDKAIASGKPKEEMRAVFEKLDAEGKFDDSPQVEDFEEFQEPEPQQPAVKRTEYQRSGIAGAFFPRSMADQRIPEQQRSGPIGSAKTLIKAGADVLGMPQRTIAGLATAAGTLHGGGTLADAYRAGINDMSRTKSTSGGVLGTAQNIALDPTLMVPIGGAASAGAKAALRGGSTLAKLARAAALGGGTGALSGAISGANGDDVDWQQVALSGGISAALPLAGSTIAGAMRKLGTGAQNVAKGIQNRGGLKVSGTPEKVDEKLETIAKYGLWGKPRKVYDTANTKIAERYQQLKTVLKQANDKGAWANPLNALDRAEVRAVREAADGEIAAIRSKFQTIRADIVENGRAGGFDLADAQLYKMKIRDHADGYWDRTKASQPPEHRVYKTFYDELKREMENKGGGDVKRLNTEMSKLISVRKDAARRVPVQERNNWIPLDETISLVGSALGAVSGNPAPVAIYAAQRIGKMPYVAKTLYGVGGKLKRGSESIENAKGLLRVAKNDNQGRLPAQQMQQEVLPQSAQIPAENIPAYKRRGIDVDRRIAQVQKELAGRSDEAARQAYTARYVAPRLNRFKQLENERAMTLAELKEQIENENIAAMRKPILTMDKLKEMKRKDFPGRMKSAKEKKASADAAKRAGNYPGKTSYYHKQ